MDIYSASTRCWAFHVRNPHSNQGDGTISHFIEEKITDQSSIIGPTQLLHGGGQISCYFLYQAFPTGKKESVYPPSNLKQWGWHRNNYELVSTFPNSPKPTLPGITQFNLPGPWEQAPSRKIQGVLSPPRVLLQCFNWPWKLFDTRLTLGTDVEPELFLIWHNFEWDQEARVTDVMGSEVTTPSLPRKETWVRDLYNTHCSRSVGLKLHASQPPGGLGEILISGP